MAQLHVVESSRDHEEAGRIIDQLRARGHAVSVDYDFLKPGMEWKRALSEAVAAADGLVAVLSANSVDSQSRKITSQWIAADIGVARASGKFVIPILVGAALPIPTLVDDLFAVGLPDINDRQRLQQVVGEVCEAIEEHLKQRQSKFALGLPVGYQHLASSVLRCREDTPYDESVFVMMKYADPATMEPKQCRLLTDIWDTLSVTLATYGLTARRADKKTYVDQLWENVCVYMLACRYGIAVLEDRAANELNPNVTLEYGFMKALNRPVALLRDLNFKHDRADLTGKLSKAFEIDADGVLKQETLQKATSDWLMDLEFRLKRRP
jgi:hypothetical protein